MSNQSLVLANTILRCTNRLEKLIPRGLQGGSDMREELVTIKNCAKFIKEDSKTQA